MLHTFVICAYKESPYLEECIKSLLAQSVRSQIMLTTATPNDWILNLCRKYHIPYEVNTGAHGLANDWNFAYQSAKTKLVTLAHQDDVYEPDYAKRIIEAYQASAQPLILFSGYSELRCGQKIVKNKLLRIKRFMLSPLKFKPFQKSIFVRRRILSLGNPICCPAVTYVKPNVKKHPFETDLKSNTDWQTWERLSRQKGAFVYISDPLMSHRIHAESTTTAIIEDNHRRQKEDMFILEKFWPSWMVGFLEKLYA